MYAGRVVEEGPARQVFDAPEAPVRAGRSPAAFPRIGDPASRFAPAGLPGDPPFPGDLPSGCPFHPRCPSAMTGAVTEPTCAARAGRRRGLRASARRGAAHEPYRAQDRRARGAGRSRHAALQVRFRGRSGGRRRGPSTASTSPSRRGEIVALVGESGCGKTTLARTLLGLERPPRGEVRYDGEPLRLLAPRPARPTAGGSSWSCRTRPARSTRGTPSTRPSPRACASTRCQRRRGDERVAEALSPAGLRPPERFFLRYPHELSGGQRQRVVIAGALALEPEVIVADEPVSLARRLGPRRDPGAAADAARRARALRARGHPRPRAWPGTSPTGSR